MVQVHINLCQSILCCIKTIDLSWFCGRTTSYNGYAYGQWWSVWQFPIKVHQHWSGLQSFKYPYPPTLAICDVGRRIFSSFLYHVIIQLISKHLYKVSDHELLSDYLFIINSLLCIRCVADFHKSMPFSIPFYKPNYNCS